MFYKTKRPKQNKLHLIIISCGLLILTTIVSKGFKEYIQPNLPPKSVDWKQKNQQCLSAEQAKVTNNLEQNSKQHRFETLCKYHISHHQALLLFAKKNDYPNKIQNAIAQDNFLIVQTFIQKFDDKSADLWRHLGLSYQLSHQYTSAITAYQTSLKISDNPLTSQDIGTVYYAMGQYQKAIKTYEKTLSSHPAKFTLFNDIGKAYGQLKQYPQAIKSFESAIKLNPKNKNAYNNLADVYGLLGQYSKAVMFYKQGDAR